MEAVAHWTQNSTADFVYSISSNFVAQIETKMEEEGSSQNEIADKMNKTSGRVSQLLNNPGNLSIRVMVELARALEMKVSIVAYEDGDPNNDRGPLDPDVFVKCWEHAGRPANLFDVEGVASRGLEEYMSSVGAANFLNAAAGQISGYGGNFFGYVSGPNELYPKSKVMTDPAKTLGNLQFYGLQLSSHEDDHEVHLPQMIPPGPSIIGLSKLQGKWQQQSPPIPEPHKEKAA
jgi:transcriptional regulator with XRE-family HTH domain